MLVYYHNQGFISSWGEQMLLYWRFLEKPLVLSPIYFQCCQVHKIQTPDSCTESPPESHELLLTLSSSRAGLITPDTAQHHSRESIPGKKGWRREKFPLSFSSSRAQIPDYCRACKSIYNQVHGTAAYFSAVNLFGEFTRLLLSFKYT